MANIQSAKKRNRQTVKRTERNRVFRSSTRTHIKKTRQLIADGNLEEADAMARKAYQTQADSVRAFSKAAINRPLRRAALRG